MALDYHNPVDVITDVESKEFQENYFKKGIPAVIKGLLPKYEAFTKWTPEYFKSLAGDIDVGIFDNSPAYMDRTIKHAPSTMKFSKYLDLVSSNEPADARLFLFDLIKTRPELKNDFYYPEIGSHFMKRYPFMFFGCKGSVVRMHQDIDYSNVFLMQFQGRKRVILFDPKYSELLYRFPFNVHTEANIIDPDYQKFPGLQYVRGYETVLNHGDVLFMPSGYWHYITYLDGGFAMSLRSLSHSWSNIAHGAVNIVFRSNIDELMRFLLGKKWFAYKQQEAQHRANIAMQKYQREHWYEEEFKGSL